MSKAVTAKSTSYAKWYTDVVTKAHLADYGPVKGTMVIRPYGFSLWDSVKETFDSRFKATGHVNAYFPMFIPKSFLSKEAEHVAGFAKECAVVTHHRLISNPHGEGLVVDPTSLLDEEVIIRPTSETVIWSMYKKWIQSYRDLPILINQWANVVRWEMRTRLFLRTTEFLWQEGHTAHAKAKEAEEEAQKILNIYQEVAEEELAIPVIAGLKTEAEKFAGAEHTYCIEAMMGDYRALQAGTSHNLGQKFAKAFDVTFQTQDNREEYVYATSWGVSTRLIGAVVMVHGDDKGLRLPPKIAPYQVVIVPIGKTEEDISSILNYLKISIREFMDNGIRFHIDERIGITPGFKFNEWEMKGVPIRLEVGKRDMKEKIVTIVKRDNGEKIQLNIEGFASKIPKFLKQIQESLFDQAKVFSEKNTFCTESYDEFKSIISDTKGFVKCGWDGDPNTELAIKEETKATIRCIPFNGDHEDLKCIYSGKRAKYKVIFGKAY
ncbi:MAG: proline--tRNA ligase [Candidatus Marinimicrobia bacterium]|nr:proline--tRNA ligase [Candidatus Neomarinimicrobiota bacterium]|tara:strand:- start:22650 stop:24125 length:1476 start_codon:yes stop_codon:yes gene_type:complete